MPDPQHRIGRLTVRAPAVDDGAGPQIAAHVQAALAGLPAPDRDVHHGRVNLRVPIAADASQADIALALTRALTHALR